MPDYTGQSRLVDCTAEERATIRRTARIRLREDPRRHRQRTAGGEDVIDGGVGNDKAGTKSGGDKVIAKLKGDVHDIDSSDFFVV